MYICEDCGKLFEEEECEIEYQPMSDEFPSYITKRIIPKTCSCGGDFVEAQKCVKCGEYTASEYGLCDSCLESEKTIDNCLEIGDEWQEDVKLNGFLMTFFDKSEIEHILKEHIKNSPDKARQKAIEEYFAFDEDYYITKVVKKWKEEK